MTQKLIRKTFTWICCKCGHSNYSDTLFYNFGICTDENTYDLVYSGVNQCLDEWSTKKKVRSHGASSKAGHGYVEQSNTKQSVTRQTGGYLLRKSKTNPSPSKQSSVNGKSKNEEKANNQTQPKVSLNMRTRSHSERTLPFIDKTGKTKTHSCIKDAHKNAVKKNASRCELHVGEFGMKKSKKRTKTVKYCEGKYNNMTEGQRTPLKRRVDTNAEMVKPAKMKCKTE